MRIVLTFAASAVVLTGRQSHDEIAINDNIPVAYVDADGTHQSATRDTTRNRFPHLLRGDGEITLNDRCPVTKAPLNNRLPVLYSSTACPSDSAEGRVLGPACKDQRVS